MTSNFTARWSRKRALGKRAYVLRYGLLLIGMSIVVLLSVLDFVNNGRVDFTYLLGRLVFFPTLGAMIAGLRWQRNERKFAELTADRP